MTKNTIHTADVIAFLGDKLVLVQREKFPFGLALPGGHIEKDEFPEYTAKREFTEETGLTLTEPYVFTGRKGKDRDPRYAMSSTTVCVGVAHGTPRDEEGCTHVVLLSVADVRALREDAFAFDHHSIIHQYLNNGGSREMKPIKPHEVEQQKITSIPDSVIESFNLLIAQSWNGRSSRVVQDDAVAMIVQKGIPSDVLFKNKWLDIEPLFRNEGWKVGYDNPAYNESYPASFTFSKKN